MTPYRELLRVPFWWVVVGLAVSVLSAAELHLGAHGLRAWLPYTVLPSLTLLGLGLLSRARITVEDGFLHVPRARAPLSAFGPPEVLDRDLVRLYLGPAAKRYAWLTVKPWVRTAVLLPVIDPEDDTPYWLVSTRHPSALAESVTGA